MWFILYLLTSFIILFVNYKRKWDIILNYEDRWGDLVDPTDNWLYWKYLVLIPLFWIILIPGYIIWIVIKSSIIFLWNTMDRIYIKYFEK